MDEKGLGASSNLEQGGDVRVRPESRLGEMETLVKTQRMDNQNGGVVISEAKQGHHPTCKQNEKITRTDMQSGEESRKSGAPLGLCKHYLGWSAQFSVNSLVQSFQQSN